MQRTVLSTDDVPEAERFAYWRDTIRAGLIGYSVERNKDQDGPFNGHVVALSGGSVAFMRSRADGCPVFRRPSDIARRSWETHYRLYREHGAGAWFGWDGGQIVTRPGDLVIAEMTFPFVAKPRINYDYEMFLFPRTLLDPHLPVSRRPRNCILSGQLVGIATAYLDAFAGQLETLDDQEIGLVADNFCRLLAVACGADSGEHKEAIRVARLSDVKQHIDRHLADCGLTPEKVARAMKISVRGLHLLFEPSGESFSQYVLKRRLEECRGTLASPLSERSVTDVALAWGFNSLATFFRTFRQAYGVTPSELRRQAIRLNESGRRSLESSLPAKRSH